MSLIMYVYHYCKITGEPCQRGSCRECPEAIGNLVTWCKHFAYRGPEEHQEEEANG